MGQLTSSVGGFKSNDSQASTCSSLGSSKSCLRHPCFEVYRKLGSSKYCLRHPCFEAHRKISRELLMRRPIAVLGLTLHVNRCSLASAMGPFSSNGSFCLVQRERSGIPSRESLLHDSTQSFEYLLHCELEEQGNHLEHVAIRTAVKVVTSGLTHKQTQVFRG